jgi:hypothetical protein
MRRPDQDKFDAFAGELRVLDADLEKFSSKNRFTIEQNACRAPCRILRRGTEPRQLVEVSMDGVWHQLPPGHVPTYTLGVGCYSEDVNDPKILWQLKQELLKCACIEAIHRELPQLLDSALALLETWDSNTVRAHGLALPNFKKIYPAGE